MLDSWYAVTILLLAGVFCLGRRANDVARLWYQTLHADSGRILLWTLGPLCIALAVTAGCADALSRLARSGGPGDGVLVAGAVLLGLCGFAEYAVAAVLAFGFPPPDLALMEYWALPLTAAVLARRIRVGYAPGQVAADEDRRSARRWPAAAAALAPDPGLGADGSPRVPVVLIPPAPVDLSTALLLFVTSLFPAVAAIVVVVRGATAGAAGWTLAAGLLLTAALWVQDNFRPSSLRDARTTAGRIEILLRIVLVGAAVSAAPSAPGEWFIRQWSAHPLFTGTSGALFAILVTLAGAALYSASAAVPAQVLGGVLLLPRWACLFVFAAAGVFHPVPGLAAAVCALAALRLVSALIAIRLAELRGTGVEEALRLVKEGGDDYRRLLGRWAVDEVFPWYWRPAPFRLCLMLLRTARISAAAAAAGASPGAATGSAAGRRFTRAGREVLAIPPGDYIRVAREAMDVVVFDALPRASAARQAGLRPAVEAILAEIERARRELVPEAGPTAVADGPAT